MITGSTGIGNGKKIVSVDHDPTAVATDAPKGSLIVEESTGHIFCKADDGDTTNVTEVVTGLPVGYLNGARMSFNSVSLVDIAAGKVRDSADGEDIAWAGTLTADIAASGANGLDTGAEAGNTWYAVHVIAGGGNAVASLLSLSPTAPTLPGTYTVFRRVGFVRNNGSSAFMSFRQVGAGRDRWLHYHVDLAGTRVLNAGAETTFTLVNLSSYVPPALVPVEISLLTQFDTKAGAASDALTLRESGATASSVHFMRTGIVGAVPGSRYIRITAVSNPAIDYLVSNAANRASIHVLGYQDEL